MSLTPRSWLLKAFSLELSDSADDCSRCGHFKSLLRSLFALTSHKLLIHITTLYVKKSAVNAINADWKQDYHVAKISLPRS